MDFEQLVDSVGAQFKVVATAPIPFLVALLILGVFVWRMMEWRYAGIIERLRDERDCLKRSQPPATLPPPLPAADGRPDSLEALRKARTNVVVAIAQGSMRTRSQALHELAAALLTMDKEYGISDLELTIPFEKDSAKLILEMYVRYVDCFYPLLRAGHVEEARSKAADFRNRRKAAGTAA